MKQLLLISFLGVVLTAGAQQENTMQGKQVFKGTEKYLSFNPFGLIESYLAIGIGFGKRFSMRSEYFTELSYVAKNPIYGDYINSLNGAKLILQYRYHILQHWKPMLKMKDSKRRPELDPFVGVEFRMKMFNFSDKTTFVNTTTHDTLHNELYRANAFSIGGALVVGSTYYISKNKRWQLETTIGIGGRQKFVNFKKAPVNYEILKVQKIDYGFIPAVYEQVGMPYFPCAVRLRYIIH